MQLPTAGDQVLIDARELHRVYRCERQNGHVLLGVINLETSHAADLVFPTGDFPRRVQVVPGLGRRIRDERLTREKFELAVEALRLRSAHIIDPLFAVNVSQIDLLPHQADAVYRHILQQPRIRFLLADDPGLGKTIMAGLILKELRARGAVERCLVVAPAHLCEQWRRELADWFREEFLILDRTMLASSPSANFFDRNPCVLVSLDFAKQDARRELLSRQEWDLVVFDEAHKLAAKRVGRKIERTNRYLLGEALAPHARHLLFLTATPHNGDDSAYHLLLELLEPGLFASAGQLKSASQANHGLPFVLRRSKDRVTDLAGNRLFRNRTVETVQLTMTAAEREVYDEVTEYVTFWYPYTADLEWVESRKRRNIALALTVLQRRVGSGMHAIFLSLQRRRQKLQALEADWSRLGVRDDELIYLDSDEVRAELDDQQAAEWEQLQERAEGISAALSLEELRTEIEDLDRIITLVRRVERAGAESKLTQLKAVVEQRLQSRPDEKLLIFSEFKDTVEYLKLKLESWELSVAMIHGGQNMDERRMQERRFRDVAQVMVATDAAAEGINLQFCRLMINYDLPWNPNRLEQRMGRIHRYGQQRDCSIWNLLYAGTREGDILARLLAKIERMRARPELGDSIYDVISVVLSGVNLERLIMDAIALESDEPARQYIDVELDERVEEFVSLLRDNALASQYIDLSAVRRFVAASGVAGVGSHDIERFVRSAVESIGGGLERNPRDPDGVFRLGIPQSHQRDYADSGYASGMRVTFDRMTAKAHSAEYVSLGHPILEKLLALVPPRQHRPYVTVLADFTGEPGTLWLYRLKATDANGSSAVERLEAFFRRSSDGQIEFVPSTRVRDLREAPWRASVPEESLRSIDADRSAVERAALSRLDQLLEEIRARRTREAAIKRTWTNESHTTLIRESVFREQQLLDRQLRGDRNLGGAITNEKRRRQTLEREHQQRLAVLEAESRLTVLAPELEAVAVVIAS